MKKEGLYWVISGAVVVCILILLCTLGQPKEKYDVVILGDSIIGNGTYNLHCTEIIEQKTGMKVFNGAFGGTCMSVVERENTYTESSLWCMAELAEAICYEDFGAQKASMAYGDYYKEINNSTLDYFKDRMEELSGIDFGQTQILIIEHGTNDYNAGQALENGDDPYDKGTFAGALRSSLKLLKETYPDLRIIVMSPIYCEIGEGKCYDTSFGGGTLEEYVEKEKEIAKEFGVEFLDAYHNSGIWEDNAEDYLDDALHLSGEGQVVLGEFLADYLLK